PSSTCLFFFIVPCPPRSTLFPYTTLFRSFADPPDEGSNNVVIAWTKADADMRKLITNCRYYGGSYYARFWLFGNPNRRNTRFPRSEEHTSELQSRENLVCRLLLEKKNKTI